MLNKAAFTRMMDTAAKMLYAKKDVLRDIDARFGDGDHGITIVKISDMMHEHLDNWTDQSIKTFFEELGKAICDVTGDSAGPLYGTMIGGFATCLSGDEVDIDGKTLKAMFKSSLAGVRAISTAQVGDKTMMDALIPAVEAAQKADDSIIAVLGAAEAAAVAGAKASEGFVSKFGRARIYKEATIGTPDAGALSVATFLEAFAQSY